MRYQHSNNRHNNNTDAVYLQSSIAEKGIRKEAYKASRLDGYWDAYNGHNCLFHYSYVRSHAFSVRHKNK